MLAAKERSLRPPPALQSGDRLRSREFLRRYEAMPEINRAELIQGVVYMGSPVSAAHSEPDGLMHTWLGFYASTTPGVRFFPNTTVILDDHNTPQPDACLCLDHGRGGKTKLSPQKYLTGPPELVVEIAVSSASIDLHDKMEAYSSAGVGEYLVWRIFEQRFDWFVLEGAAYVSSPADRRGCLRSRNFPGLVLDVKALLEMNSRRVLSVLQRSLRSKAHQEFVAGTAST